MNIKLSRILTALGLALLGGTVFVPRETAAQDAASESFMSEN